MLYRVTKGGLEPSSSGDVTFDSAPRTTGNESGEDM